MRLAVLGSPVAHSLSPKLHSAAYRQLGLDWHYDRIEMTGAELPGFIATLDSHWRGLSLTMPVKQDILHLLDGQDELVRLTGACNTVVNSEGHLDGFNTDIYGIEAAFTTAGIDRLTHAVILGAGATAASAVVAAKRLGADKVTIMARNPDRAGRVAAVGAALGVDLEVVRLGLALDGRPDAVMSTLPNGASIAPEQLGADLRQGAVLFDVAYDPWPSSLGRVWSESGGQVISGFEMLLHQAVMQVRIFAGDGADVRLPDEDAVIEVMRKAAFDRAG